MANPLRSARSDKRAYLLNAETGVEITRFQGHSQSVTAVGFTGDGSRLMTASSDATVQVWNIAGHNVERTISLQDQNARVRPSTATGPVFAW